MKEPIDRELIQQRRRERKEQKRKEAKRRKWMLRLRYVGYFMIFFFLFTSLYVHLRAIEIAELEESNWVEGEVVKVEQVRTLGRRTRTMKTVITLDDGKKYEVFFSDLHAHDLSYDDFSSMVQDKEIRFLCGKGNINIYGLSIGDQVILEESYFQEKNAERLVALAVLYGVIIAFCALCVWLKYFVLIPKNER